MQEAIEQMTALRKDTSKVLKSIVYLNEHAGSADGTLAYRSAQKAFMWLGIAKGEAGSANPYPESMAANTVIEAPVDISEDEALLITIEGGNYEDMSGSVTIGVKAIRLELDKLKKRIRSEMNTFPDNVDFQLALGAAYVNMTEAKMWLGQLLGMIKESADNQKKLIQDRLAEEEEDDEEEEIHGDDDITNNIQTGGMTPDSATTTEDEKINPVTTGTFYEIMKGLDDANKDGYKSDLGEANPEAAKKMLVDSRDDATQTPATETLESAMEKEAEAANNNPANIEVPAAGEKKEVKKATPGKKREPKAPE